MTNWIEILRYGSKNPHDYFMPSMDFLPTIRNVSGTIIFLNLITDLPFLEWNHFYEKLRSSTGTPAPQNGLSVCTYCNRNSTGKTGMNLGRTNIMVLIANLGFNTRKSCSQINFLSRRGEKQKWWFSHTALGVLFYIHRFLIYLTKYIFPLISGSGGGTIENGFIPIMYGQGD